ncbi:hypothetical protein HNV08_05475 [Winogradskyella eckloniae]|uniref:hypothetical protein n=1 Tax=Winogradskyella eckloniae TaxID=1089306 RepID=UPI0015658868|nr:hypothetical protein [Winogradskyella eckloniae]NRD19489.1 hypothetical protein [Winogradskyella eckloniae]
MTTIKMKRKIEGAKDLDFGTIFNQSIELFKKVWVQGLVVLLLGMVLAMPIGMLVYVPLILTGFLDVYSSTYDAYSTVQPEIGAMFFVSFGFVYLILILGMSIITLGLYAAFYRICKLKDLEQMGSEDYFYFFKKPYLGKTIKLGLVFGGILLLALLLCVFPIIYVFVPLAFLVTIYAFNPDMAISDIVKMAFDLGNKKWFMAFGLIVVSGILASVVGFCMCFVGMYVTRSFSSLPVYFIYKEVIGFDDEDETPQIEENTRF